MCSTVLLEENAMQTVYDQRLFGMPVERTEAHIESRAEALRVHSAMDPAEARLGWQFFWYGLAVSGLILLGAYFFNL